LTVSLKAQAWREEFRGCLDCWENQVDTEEDLDDCDSAGSRHYVKPWTYVPGAKSTFFNSFMKSCLDWAKANPGTPYPACENLDVTPDDYEYCPNGEIFFTAQNGNGAYIVGADCGEITGVMLWTAPADTGECPEETKIYFEDADGRKGCVYLIKKDEDECCCEINPEVGIEFVSLQMSCSESQDLGIDPEAQGCPPYAWALDGGGSLSDTEGLTVTYTAPASNPNCENNPTITVTDKCGNSGQIKIAVNCNEDPYTAFLHQECECCPPVFWSGLWWYPGNWSMWTYHCDGTLRSECISNPDCESPIVAQCAGGDCGQETGCYSNECQGVQGQPCGFYDRRNQDMKDKGCCPINPVTGLPW
jgi:hypothetical protein